MTVKFRLLALLEAKPDKGADLAAFLVAGRELALQEEGTVTWYAFRIGYTTFGIFDTFETEDARRAHLNGQIPEALAQVAPTCSRRIPTSARSTSSRSSSRSRDPWAIRRPVRASAAAWLGTSRRSLVVEAEQEGDRRGQHDPVGERHPPREQRQSDQHELEHVPLTAWVESGREVRPQLPEQDRERDRGVEGDDERRREGLRDAEGDRLLAVERGVQPADDRLVEPVAEREGRRERPERDEQAGAELAEMLDELHALSVAEATGEEGHRPTGWRARAPAEPARGQQPRPAQARSCR